MSTLPAFHTPALGDVGVAWAAAGWPVIPLHPRTKRRRTRSGTQPSTDLPQVREWWTRWPAANVGVVLNEVPVVVIDIDGPRGCESLLRLLSRSGVDALPDTFEVTTGRPDGGSHRWYRLPAGAPKLINQLGANYRETRALDVLFQGLVVAPGSVHMSGRLYTANTAEVPRPEDLAELPVEVYQVLRNRGRIKAVVPVQAPAPVSGPPLAGVEVQDRRLDWVVSLLQDTSDGRDGRVLKAVTGLVLLGLSNEEVIETVLDFPLGGKAREQRDPHGYLHRKIAKARTYVPDEFDKQGYWSAVHAAALTPAQTRILDCLLRDSTNGVIAKSLAWIAIDSAISSAGLPVKTLIQQGWLTVLSQWDLDGPTLYRLTIPEHQECPQVITTHDEDLQLRKDTPPPSLITRRWCFTSHDAFRPKSGSLHTAYPLLCLLNADPRPEQELTTTLGLTRRAFADRVRALVAAGVAVVTEAGVALTDQPLLPLLDRAAEAAGTTGARAAAVEEHFLRVEEWRRARAEATVVGSPTWRRLQARHYRRVLDQPPYAELRRQWDDDEAFIEHLVDGAVTFHVESRGRLKSLLEASVAAGMSGCGEVKIGSRMVEPLG